MTPLLKINNDRLFVPFVFLRLLAFSFLPWRLVVSVKWTAKGPPILEAVV